MLLPNRSKDMLLAKLIVFLSIVLALSTKGTNANRTPAVYDVHKIKLADVESITFVKGLFTSGRRRQAYPQLSCQGNACWNHRNADSGTQGPTAIQCTNIAFKTEGVKWECAVTAYSANEDPSSYFMSNPRLNCEGYEYDNDPNILAGSCHLIYELHRTPEAQKLYEASLEQKRQEQQALWNSRRDPGGHSFWPGQNQFTSGVNDLIRLVLFGAFAYFIYRLLFTNQDGFGRAGEGQVLESKCDEPARDSIQACPFISLAHLL
ncbi:hypothetical protein DFJ77DRAFT_326748 [Powellomyces hirtus]|nr:hypothetical protein DFJ77DRAFT_326748 [Powellomyces hirtus]